MSARKILQYALTVSLLVSPVMQVNAEQLAAELINVGQVTEEQQELQLEDVKEEMNVQQLVELVEESSGEELESAWQSGTPMPTPRYGFGTATVDGKIYTIGGSTYELGPATGVVEVYDTKTDTWSTVTQMLIPKKASGVAEINGEIYVFGGGGAQATSTVQIYNVKKDEWRNAASMPHSVYSPKVAVVDEKIYILDIPLRNFFFEYDPITDVWTPKQLPPTTRLTGRVGLTVFNNEIHALGGLTPGGYSNGNITSPIYHDTVLKYDMENDQWEDVTEMKMLTGRYEVEAVEVDGNLFLVDVRAPENSTEIYVPEEQHWYNLERLPEAEPQGDALIVDNTNIVLVDGEVYVINRFFTNRYTFDYKTPGAPRNFKKILLANDIALEWNPVYGAEVYNVYRSYSPEGPYTSVAENVYGPSYRYHIPDEDLHLPLYYVVTSENSFAESEYSDVIDYTPNTPINVDVEPGGDLTLITWDAADDREGIEYSIYHYFLGEWEEIGSTAENYFVHEELINYRTYRYKVHAVNSSGVSPSSEEVETRTIYKRILPIPRIPLSIEQVDGQVKVSWEYENGSILYYSLARGSGEELVTFPITTDSFYFDDYERESGKVYNYFLIGADENGNFKVDSTVHSIVEE
ncbi:fibronectin type III domain-containing protein [Longirhabdus pacifica]|uniref:fibronectin type III domain-containing protein n=1 Tax=Longirhabdus pacifica TaxID=2305227 RepID=UPI0013E8DF7B|nr:fibronectin type III domain-containing protein [Longirhabdus pacifica]